MKGISTLLAEDGVLYFEDPYLGEILRCGVVDQFYGEHALYFSVASVRAMVAPYGLELVAAIPQPQERGALDRSTAVGFALLSDPRPRRSRRRA